MNFQNLESEKSKINEDVGIEIFDSMKRELCCF